MIKMPMKLGCATRILISTLASNAYKSTFFPQHSIMQVQKKLVLYVGFETEAGRK